MELIKAAQAMMQENRAYSICVDYDEYYCTLTVGCLDYESFRWLVSIMDETRFFEKEI